MHALCVPPDVGLPSHRIAATRAAKRYNHCRGVAPAIPIITQFSEYEPEMENMPGTPPLLETFDKISAPLTNESKTLIAEDSLLAEHRMQRINAASVIQRRVRCFIATRERARLRSAVGRPAEIIVTAVDGLELFCDYRDLVSMHCVIRVLKKPFGPFMFQFKTSECSHTGRPTWSDEIFFVPMISSRCLVVATLVGTTAMGKQRFLGQSVAPLDNGWEQDERELCASLGKWKFPLDNDMASMHRFVKGRVHCIVRPFTISNTLCHCGQFQIPPVASTDSPNSLFRWSRRKSVPNTLSPEPLTTPPTPTCLRKGMITRWGVLTDTHVHLFDHTTAQPCMSFELSKIQMIRSIPLPKDAKCRREPNQLFPIKIYNQGTVYTLYVSTYAQVLMWEYKIDLHRRRLLVP